MRRCLTERELLFLYMGDGTPIQQSHLETCANCARRYEHLRQDLLMIDRSLRMEPPPQPIRIHSPERTTWGRFWNPERWQPAAFALTIGLVIMVSAWWMWHPPVPPPQAMSAAQRAELWQFLHVASVAVFGPEEALAADRASWVVADPLGLSGTVEPPWPCGQAIGRDGNGGGFPLLCEGERF